MRCYFDLICPVYDKYEAARRKILYFSRIPEKYNLWINSLSSCPEVVKSSLYPLTRIMSFLNIEKLQDLILWIFLFVLENNIFVRNGNLMAFNLFSKQLEKIEGWLMSLFFIVFLLHSLFKNALLSIFYMIFNKPKVTDTINNKYI